MRFLYTCCLILFIHYIVLAQVSAYCNFDERYHFDATYSEQVHIILNNLPEYNSTERAIVEIPVVVHIVYRLEEDNISDEQVFEQIEILNEAFNGQALTDADIPSEFLQSVAAVNFKFCLANTDPDGNPVSGVTRKEVETINIGSLDRIYYDAQGGVDAWDTDRYINIWVAETNKDIIGKASFPGIGPEEEQGIVMDVQYFGGPNSLNYDDRYLGGKSLIHEMGHYFGLQHLWGSTVSDCASDDGIEDTPITGTTYVNSCQLNGVSCGSVDMTGNYMMYSSDDCLHYFTKGQRSLMHNVLATYRNGLRSTNITCTPTEEESEVLDFKLVSKGSKGLVFDIEGQGLGTALEASLYDLSGKLIWSNQQIIDQEFFYLPMKNKSPGVYVIVLNNASSFSAQKFFWH